MHNVSCTVQGALNVLKLHHGADKGQVAKRLMMVVPHLESIERVFGWGLHEWPMW